MTTVSETLQHTFGHTHFRPGQREVVDALLRGESSAAVFPTGSGKSLCYQLPAVLLPGVTLVVSPLLALMKDQVDALSLRGISAARLDSTLTLEDYLAILKKAKNNELKLLYVAPERFQNERFRQTLSELQISLFAVDEAHCVSEWGHNFRPDYLKLANAAQACQAERILALTATATPKVLDDICRTFGISHRVRTPFHRPNLILNSSVVATVGEKYRRLRSLLGQGATVVYVTLQKTSEQLAQRLADEGLQAKPYHAGLAPEQRAQTQEWFLHSESGIVVATIAFGMGIDKPDIRCVVHYDPPKSLESYSQEIGRAGRDGEDAQCRLIFFSPDRIPLENFVYGDTPTRTAINSLLRELFGQSDEIVLNLTDLSNTHDIRPLVLRTLLTYLELDGYLEERTPVYASYQFKALIPSREILSKVSGEPQAFLAAVFRQAQKKRIWFTIDLEDARTKLSTTRERLVKALDWCHNNGYLEVRTADLRHRYRVTRRPASLDALTRELDVRAQVREEGEIARLQQVLSATIEPGCLSAKLSEHFGETIPNHRCERCGDCLGRRKNSPIVADTPPWTLPSLPPGLGKEPRLAARFLCGVTSPSLVRNKWTRDPLFASLAGASFKEVLEALNSITEANSE